MIIKFTHDFRGKLTNELFYLKGTEIEIDAEIGAQLIELEHAVDATPEEPEPEQAKESTAPKEAESKPVSKGRGRPKKE